MEIIENSLLYATLTFVTYFLAKILQEKTGWVILNPLMVSILALIVILECTGVDYPTYQQGGSYISFWLKPAIVALGLPLYKQLNAIRKQMLLIAVSQVIGCVVGIITGVLIARVCGASDAVVMSMAPKSITTPIAIEVSHTLGGIPALTAAIVILVGIFGAMCGYRILQLFGVKNPISQAISMGTAAHALGTAESTRLSDRFGAYSSLGLILNGLLTAVLAPLIISLL